MQWGLRDYSLYIAVDPWSSLGHDRAGLGHGRGGFRNGRARFGSASLRSGGFGRGLDDLGHRGVFRPDAGN